MVKSTVIAAALLAAVVCTGATASAQASPYRSAVANVGFSFVVDGQTLPPGVYLFEVDNARLLVRPQTGNMQGLFTRVRNEGGNIEREGTPEIVFDKLDGQLCLSEVAFPGEDSFSVLSTKRDHQHVIVAGSKARK